MEVPLKIALRNLELGEASRALIRQQVEKLEQFCGEIIACRVTVEIPQRYPAHTPVEYKVGLDLVLPGEELVVTRQADREIETAIQNAFDAAGRRVEDYVRRRRGDVKRHEETPRGVVSKLFAEDGYGFIQTADGREVYFHRNAVLHGRFDEARVGTEVRFHEEEGDEGPQASTVALAGKQHR